MELEEIVKVSKQLHLLYIEDNETTRETTKELLDEFFNEISVAINGEDGLEKFKNNSIDLIITDINMPKLSGLAMSEKIREIDQDVPILVVSAHNETNFFIESIKVGVDGFILKPIDLGQFLSSLQKIIQKISTKMKSERTMHILKQYQEIFDKSAIVSKTDLKGYITYVNGNFCKISKYSKEDLIGTNHNIVRHPDIPKKAYKDMWHTIKDKKEIWQGKIKNLDKEGKSYYINSTIKPMLDENDNIVEYMAVRHDITNVTNVKEQLNDIILLADETIVVFIEIEGFSNIINFYGEKETYNIEEKFANILFNNIFEYCDFDGIFTLGDGIFAFAKDKKNCTLPMDKLISNLKLFQQNISTKNITITDMEYDISILISLSYGEDVLENARYGLKELTKTTQDFIVANDFVKKEQETASNNIKVLKMIKQALNSNNIISYFQPIIDNKTQEIVKYESLVRLIDENDKVISPFFFLDISKKAKYYAQITNVVLENSFQALSQTDVDISINISVLDIEKQQTREKIFDLLEQYKDITSRIVFELLEDEDAKDFLLVKTFIEKVKEYGVKIAIDDFGAGYSNFERLMDYQPDILKIDGSLIKDIVTNDYSLSVVKAIVTFAKDQNIEIIAEYVENENIYKVLKELDINYSQGYYFSPPKPLEAK